MARDINDIYTLPAGSVVSPGDEIEAFQHNTPLLDLAEDNNTARPIAAGGTGGITAFEARVNLQIGGLPDDNVFTGDNTFRSAVKVEGAEAYLDLQDTDELAAGFLEVGLRLFDSAGTEVGYFGRQNQSALRAQSRDGPLWFEADSDSLDDVESPTPFVWFHRGNELARLTNEGEFGISRLRLSQTTDVTLDSTEHAFQIGADTGTNLRLDGNEIQSLNNGAGTPLFVQSLGGALVLGKDGGGDVTTKATHKFAYGSAGSPSMAFDGDADTGIYRGSSNLVCIVGGGVIRGRFDSTGTGTINGQTVMTREKGDARYARQAASPGGVDTYGFFRRSATNTGITLGTRYNGSSLRWAGVYDNRDPGSGTPSGTWEAVGYAQSDGSSNYSGTIFYRVT